MATKRRKWKWPALGALAFGSFFLLGFLATTQIPRLERFARVKIEKVSRERLPVRIFPGRLELTAFPFGARAYDVRVLPDESAAKWTEPLRIKEVRVALSVFHLLQGRLRLSDVEIDGVEASLRAPKPEKSEGPPLAGLFDAIEGAPVGRIAIANASLRVEAEDPKIGVEIGGLEFAAEKTRAGLAVDLSALGVRVRDAAGDRTDRLDFEARGVLDRREIFVSGLSVRRGDSHAVASGELRGDVENLKVDDFDLKTRASLQLEPMRAWLAKAYPKAAASVPPLKGSATIEAKTAKRAGQKEPEIEFTARTEKLTLDRRFFLDRIEAHGVYRSGGVEIDKASLTNPGGRLDVAEAKIVRRSEGGAEATTISARASVPHFDLHAFLPTLGAGEVPVYMSIAADFPACGGEIAPKFRLKCAGKAKAVDGVIKAGAAAKNRIVAFPLLEVEGEATVDADQVSYKAEARTKDGRGRSEGTIGYKTGFQIAFEADALPFADLATLGELKLEGSVALKGSTSGNADAATFAMAADGRDLWLEDWHLGAAKSQIAYKSGMLTFADLAGHYATSRYAGKVTIDFKRNELAVDLAAPFIDAKDLLLASSRKFTLPMDVTGTGQAEAKVTGPFRFNALTYDLKSTLYRGAAAREPFDYARFDVRARKGEVESQRVEIVRGPASIRLDGRGHPNGDVDAMVRGRGIRLEDLNALSKAGVQLAGLLEFDMHLKDYVLAPDAELKGTLTRASIGDQAAADSSFRLKFGKRTIEGGGSLLGDALKADVVWPLAADAPFALNVSAQDWNFAPAIAAFGGPQASRKEYEARITGSTKLAAQTGGFWNASGSFDAQRFSIKRGSLKVEAPEPLLASMRAGRVSIERFRLEGDGSSLKATDAANRNGGPQDAPLNAQLNGKMDLSLAAFLTPFFEDLRGSLSFAVNAKAGPKGASILGSAYVDRGYLKLFDFPHPFEEIKADALFNERKLLLNSLRGDFAGGKFSADGSIEFKAYKNFPLLVNAQIDKVTLNVPEKVTTRGSARLQFSGSWFPFLMKGTYEVRDGLVAMEFGQSNAVEGVKRSAYLPNAILQETAAPIVLDVAASFPRGVEVKNALMDGRATGELRILGPPGKFSILGAISADRDTKVTFRESVIFEVLTGTATFDDPNDVNPRLYVSARTRLQTPKEDFDVNLVVQGRAKDPKVSLSSQPPRPEKDIISLLALGTDTSANDAIANVGTTRTPGLSSGTQVAGTGATVGATLLSKPINAEIKKKTGFDVSFTSSFDDTTNGAVPKVIASRQFTPKFGVSASRSFGQEPRTDAKVRYRLSNKVSAVGSWEGLDRTETGFQAQQQRQDNTLNKLGLDLEYKFEFK